MAVDYNALLTPEQKKNILEQRISQFAAEAYQHSLNKVTLESLGDSEAVANTEKALAVLEAAINTHKAELDALEGAE